MIANSFNLKPFFTKRSDHVGVKICGIKNQADAIAAIQCGADALGFNLYPGSKRFIEWRREAAWIRDLPGEVARIAVVVDLSLDEAGQLLETDLFDGVQLHGEESSAYCQALANDRKLVFKAVRFTTLQLLERVRAYPVFGFLIDSHREGSFGGTGEPFDWTLLEGVDLEKPLIVAGGLTPENVASAVRKMRPYAVDVASGVENGQGLKDKKKMADFVLAVRGS